MIRLATLALAFGCCTPLAHAWQEAEPAELAEEKESKGLERPDPNTELTPEQAREYLDRSLSYLVTSQNEDGSWSTHVNTHLSETGFAWQTFYAWQLGAHGLATLGLRAAPSSPEVDAALEKAIRWLCTTRMPVRGADWDVDSTWGSLYGFSACVEAATDVRFQSEEWQAMLKKRGMEFFADLKKRQTPDGGWAYYDNRPFTQRPTWATSFCTALVLPALKQAIDLKWEIPEYVPKLALRLVKRCHLPNGAYAYDYRPVQRGWGGESINAVKGSLGRIQVCNLALATWDVEFVTEDKLREGLANLFEHHIFLDTSRMRPIPHEGFYANAGYFYFFAHYYAARVIELLPEEEREGWHRKLRFHVAKTIKEDGSTSDFLTSGYMITGSTAYASMVLSMGLPKEPAGR